MSPRFGAYHRVSQLNGRDPDAESYITEKDAWDQIDGWAKMRSVEIAEPRYLDRDVSGSKMDRPQLNRMLADLRAGKIDGIVVAKVDRLSRADVGDALRVVAEINEIAPGKLAILDLGLDPGSDTGEMILGVLLVLARWQWKRYRAQWSSARERAVDRGVWIGEAPFGYWATVAGHKTNGKPQYGPLEVDAETGPIVREAFRIAAADGFNAARRHLERATGKRWRADRTRRLLRSRAYLGEVVLGELVKTEAHEPLTTPDRFAAAQALPDMTAPPRRASADYPLSGIASCGKCGARLTGNLQRVRGHTYRRMRCSNDDCRGTSINADKLDAYVRDRVGVALGARANRARYGGDGLDDAREALERAQGDLQRWAADDRTRDLIGDQAFYAGLEDRNAKVQEADDRYRQVAGQAARTEALPAVRDLEDPEQFARALEAMVKDVRVSGRGSVIERSEIVWDCDFATLQTSAFQEPVADKAIERGMQALADGQRQRRRGAEIEVGR